MTATRYRNPVDRASERYGLTRDLLGRLEDAVARKMPLVGSYAMECRLGFVAVGFREPDMTYDFCKPDVIFDDPYACFTVRVLQPPLATYNKLNLIDTVQAVPAIFALAPDSPWFVLGSTFWRLFSTLRAAEAVQ